MSPRITQFYSADTLMSDLICERYDLLLVITRFGIPLGFGDQTIREVCEENNVHVETLIAVVNTIVSHNTKPSQELLASLSPMALVDFLKRSHHYFLDYRLPKLLVHLRRAIEGGPEEIVFLINKFFDQYVAEVHKHMGYEDKNVFPYVRALVDGTQKRGAGAYNIDIFSRRHDKVEARIGELKNILIKYFPDGSGYELTSVLHELFSAEDDLATHNFVEDFLFVPLIRSMEQKQNS